MCWRLGIDVSLFKVTGRICICSVAGKKLCHVGAPLQGGTSGVHWPTLCMKLRVKAPQRDIKLSALHLDWEQSFAKVHFGVNIVKLNPELPG